MNEVYETLGDDGVNMDDDSLADLIRECNYKTELTIDKLLARNGAQPDGKNSRLQMRIKYTAFTLTIIGNNTPNRFNLTL